MGFRYATYLQAHNLALTGWVRNLPDGRVEAEFEGPKERLNEMLSWCYGGPRSALVSEVEATWETSEARYSDFRLRAF